MSLLRKLVVGVSATLLFAGAAFAQEKDRDAVKKRILAEVEKRLKEQEERLLRELEKFIDEELAKLPKAGAEAPKKIDPPVKETPKPAAKRRGFLGVQLGMPEPDELEQLGLDGGVLVVSVQEGSPAAQAGLQNEDIVIEAAGEKVGEIEDLVRIVQRTGAGNDLKFVVARDGKKLELTVRLGRHPEDEGEAPEPPKEPGKGSDDDLQKRMKKFLEKEGKEERKPEEKEDGDSGTEPDFLAIPDEVFEQVRGALTQLGMDPEQYFEQGDDGLWRPAEQYRHMFKQFKSLLAPPRRHDDREGEAERPVRKESPKPGRESAAKPASGPPAWLGIQVDDLEESTRAQLDLEEGVGLVIADVVSDSPAEKSGLKKQDLLLQIDGKPVRGEESLRKFMESATAGQESKFTVMRKGEEKTVTVVLGERGK